MYLSVLFILLFFQFTATGSGLAEVKLKKQTEFFCWWTRKKNNFSWSEQGQP